MKLSTRMRYGTRVLIDLAEVYPDHVVSIKQLAEEQRLSVKYLEHIMLSLKTASLVKVTRGKHGGYALARAPATISLLDVYKALEGPIYLVDCVESPASCAVSDTCVTRDIWIEMMVALESVLAPTSMEDMIQRKREKRRASLSH